MLYLYVTIEVVKLFWPPQELSKLRQIMEKLPNFPSEKCSESFSNRKHCVKLKTIFTKFSGSFSTKCCVLFTRNCHIIYILHCWRMIGKFVDARMNDVAFMSLFFCINVVTSTQSSKSFSSKHTPSHMYFLWWC